MGHANSKPKKKGIEKERSRSRSFIKPKKRENSISNNNNNVNNNGSNTNNENDTPTSSPTTATTSTTTVPSTPSPPASPSPPATPTTPRNALNISSDFSEKHNNNIRKLSNGAEQKVEKVRSQSNSSLRDSTIFEEDEKPVEIIDEDVDQDQCPLCEEETLSMYALEVCGHSVCVPCLYAYSEHQLKNLSPDQHEILCPVPECTCIISSTDLKAALDTFGATSPTTPSTTPRTPRRTTRTTPRTPRILSLDGDGADSGEVVGEKERRKSEAEDNNNGGEGSSSGGMPRRESITRSNSGGSASGSGGMVRRENSEGSASGSGERDGEVVEEVGESSSGSGSGGSGKAKRNSNPRLPIQLTHSLEQLLSKGNFIHCPNPQCKFVFEKLPPTARKKSEVVLDEAGNPISPEASKHREEHRFRCRVCGTNFCAACKTVPYHLGFTCKQKIAAMRAKHCRFCDVALPASAKPHNARVTTPMLVKKKDKAYRKSFLLAMKWKGKSKTDVTQRTDSTEEIIEENPKEFFVCKAKECTTKMGQACSRFLECGHVCAGTYNDLPLECFCLKESCCADGKQNGTEFCNICWTEALASGPCYRLACSHVFHVSCITSKLTKEYPGPSISFTFMNCPLCSQVVQHRALDGIVAPFRHLFDQVKARALERLQFEGLANDVRVTEPAGDFFGKPAEYAMSIFSFYMCFVCRHPYFGGRRQCEVPQAAEGAESPPFNPQELLCGGCSTLNAKCTKHGKEYIEYKCRFCCSLATFYCGGKAHFCTACHDKAGQLVEFINWTTTAKCEPCKGPGLCPLGMQHKENGEEFSLGCSICRLTGV